MRKPEPVAPPRLPIAVRAAVSTAIPVLLGWAAGDVGAGLIATLGAFTSRFGVGRPYLSRGVQLAVVAVALAAAVAAGAWAADIAWLGVLTISAVAVTAVWLCTALAVGPPGAYVFVVACAAGVGVSASHLSPGQIALLVLAGGAIAWLVQMVGAATGFRRPERAAVRTAAEAVAAYLDTVGEPDQDRARHRAATALHQAWTNLVNHQPLAAPAGSELARLRATTHAVHVLFADAMSAAARGEAPEPGSADVARALGARRVEPDTIAHRDPDRLPLGRPPTRDLLRQALQTGSQTRRVMARVALGVPLAGFAAVGLGVDRAYWAMAAAVLVLHQGTPLWRTLRRGAERLAGTWIGLGLAAAVIVVHPQGWFLAVVLALLNFAIEMLVTRHYLVASVFITATALTIGTASRHLEPGQVGHLLLARGLDTLIGCAVGMAVYVVLAGRQEIRRLDDAIARTRTAIAATEPFVAAGDADSQPARAARRDLQRATLDMLEAHEAAAGGSKDQRAAADRLWPDVVAAEHTSYETIAALWAIETR